MIFVTRTQNRQDAVREMAETVDIMIVVGSKNSSNSNRLRELAEKLGTPGYLTDCPEDINPLWFDGQTKVGVTAGASAPEELVNQIIARIQELTQATVEELSGREENMFFEVPRELQVKNITD